MTRSRRSHSQTRLAHEDDDQALVWSELPPNALSISLADLPPDNTGAIVIQTGGDRLQIELTDYGLVLRRGIALDGAQSEHFDVSGMDFVAFDRGITLYFSADQVHLVLAPKSPLLAPRSGKTFGLARLIDSELTKGRR